MPMIETVIEPRRVTRVFFDCRDAAPDPDDQRRITKAVEAAFALAQDDDDEPDAGPMLLPTGALLI
jgi:hypothetical protein